MRLREVRRKMGHYIHRIGGNYQYGIGCIGKDFRHNLAEHVSIALQKLQPVLARLLVNSGSYYDGEAPFQIYVTAGGYFQRSGKWDGVINIVSLGTTASFIFVNQHDFAADPFHHHGVSRCRTDKTTSDNTNFHKAPPCSTAIKFRCSGLD